MRAGETQGCPGTLPHQHLAPITPLICLGMFAYWHPGLWQGLMHVGQSLPPASPGSTGIFLAEPSDQTLVMLQAGGTQRGLHYGPTLGQFSNASPISAAS